MKPGMSRKELEQLCQTLDATGCVAFEGECWLKGWKKSTHNGLPELTVNVSSDEEMEPFETATVKKGKVAGQRYKVLFFEIDDDEEIIQEVPVKLKGGKLSIEAAGLCKNTSFQAWVARDATERVYPESEEGAKQKVYDYCGISSRAELDHNADAATNFACLKDIFRIHG